MVRKGGEEEKERGTANTREQTLDMQHSRKPSAGGHARLMLIGLPSCALLEQRTITTTSTQRWRVDNAAALSWYQSIPCS